MKVFVLLCLAGVSLASPGGYIAKGGVYDFKRPLDYMGDAVQAGKFAWNKKFESELEGEQVASETRGERNAPNYIPTFFTSQQNYEQLTNNNRPQRETLQPVEPLYYETYHNRK